jgi:hypothetical protein
MANKTIFTIEKLFKKEDYNAKDTEHFLQNKRSSNGNKRCPWSKEVFNN